MYYKNIFKIFNCHIQILTIYYVLMFLMLMLLIGVPQNNSDEDFENLT